MSEEVRKILQNIETEFTQNTIKYLSKVSDRKINELTDLELFNLQKNLLMQANNLQETNKKVIKNYDKVLKENISLKQAESLRNGREFVKRLIDSVNKNKAQNGYNPLKNDTQNKELLFNQQMFTETYEKVQQAESYAMKNCLNNFFNILQGIFVYKAFDITIKRAIDLSAKKYIEEGATGGVNIGGKRFGFVSYADTMVKESVQNSFVKGIGITANSYGFRYCKIVAHTPACDTCLKWMNKLLIDDIDGEHTPDGKGTPFLSDAIIDGLFHFNCRCTKVPFIPGIDKELIKPKDFDKKQAQASYVAEQRQRYLQNKIRKKKQVRDNALDDATRIEAEKSIKHYQKLLREHIKESEKQGLNIHRQAWKEDTHFKFETFLPKDTIKFEERISEYLRYLAKKHSGRTFNDNEAIPDSFCKLPDNFNHIDKRAIYNYTEKRKGINLNRALGTGQKLTPEQMELDKDLEIALNKMSLPEDTVLFRGANSSTIPEWKELLKSNVSTWEGEEIHLNSYTSTSVYSGDMYSEVKDVKMVILQEKNKPGAGYVNDISYNKLNNLKEEHEVLLQKKSTYAILEAHQVGKMYILVLRRKL